MSTTKVWMPLYIADYIADTTRLTTEQHGAYLLLIMDYWRNGPLPDDDAALANITRLQVPAWKKHRSTIARMFQVEGGEWRHKRIDAERLEAEENSFKYAERAKKAAAKRWGKQNPKDSGEDYKNNPLSDASSIASSIPSGPLVECTSPSPIYSVPNGTGGKPPKMTDPLEIIFGYGLSLLVNTGTPEKHGRSFLGGLRKQHGDDVLIDKLRECALAKPLQPLEWLAAALPPTGSGKKPGRVPVAENFDTVDYGVGGDL